MRPFVFTFLLAVSTCLAHYRLDYESRNMIERNEPIKMDGYDLVECPVCNTDENWRYREESCELIENKRYKKCYYGIYQNKACGNRYDCYRGVNEDCMLNDNQDIRCKRGSRCNDLNKCSGSEDHEQNDLTREFMFVHSNRWPLNTHII